MNYLAHVYLSGNSDEIKIGNFIGDYVKGKNYMQYPELIQKGILIHRNIDSFTDSHPVVHRSKSQLNPKYHKYSGIIIDIFYDHFLAKEWENFSKEPLKRFVYQFYETLIKNFKILPKRVKQFLPIFILNNWMESYLTIDGIGVVLHRMSKRTSLPDYSKFAINELRQNYDRYRADFYEYFPILIDYIEREHQVRINRPETKN
jgi:acyl carrier protein phosphodiesterase